MFKFKNFQKKRPKRKRKTCTYSLNTMSHLNDALRLIAIDSTRHIDRHSVIPLRLVHRKHDYARQYFPALEILDDKVELLASQIVDTANPVTKVFLVTKIVSSIRSLGIQFIENARNSYQYDRDVVFDIPDEVSIFSSVRDNVNSLYCDSHPKFYPAPKSRTLRNHYEKHCHFDDSIESFSRHIVGSELEQMLSRLGIGYHCADILPCSLERMQDDIKNNCWSIHPASKLSGLSLSMQPRFSNIDRSSLDTDSWITITTDATPCPLKLIRHVAIHNRCGIEPYKSFFLHEVDIFKRELLGQVNHFCQRRDNCSIFNHLDGYYNTSKTLTIERVWCFQLNDQGLLGSAGARAKLMHDNFDLSKPAQQKIDIMVTKDGFLSID